MTPDAFRRLALSLPDTSEGQHMQHPDFRVNGRIFATLHPDGLHGMVKVSPQRQRDLLRAHADDFTPAAGAWGRQGCTLVVLATVGAAVLRDAMTDAWQLAMAQPARATRPAARGKRGKERGPGGGRKPRS